MKGTPTTPRALPTRKLRPEGGQPPVVLAEGRVGMDMFLAVAVSDSVEDSRSSGILSGLGEPDGIRRGRPARFAGIPRKIPDLDAIVRRESRKAIGTGRGTIGILGP